MFWCAACGVVLRVTPTKKRMRRDGKNMEMTFKVNDSRQCAREVSCPLEKGLHHFSSATRGHCTTKVVPNVIKCKTQMYCMGYSDHFETPPVCNQHKIKTIKEIS